jgi:hypothetical protein
LSLEEIYALVKEDSHGLHLMYEGYLIDLLGKQNFMILKESGLIEDKGLYNDRRMYTLKKMN